LHKQFTKQSIIECHFSPGPFIYKGAGQKQSDSADITQKMCKKESCLIQMCLAKYQYQQSKCDIVIDSWKNCCIKAKDREATMLEKGEGEKGTT
jgi:hypothetical protein